MRFSFNFCWGRNRTGGWDGNIGDEGMCRLNFQLSFESSLLFQIFSEQGLVMEPWGWEEGEKGIYARTWREAALPSG